MHIDAQEMLTPSDLTVYKARLSENVLAMKKSKEPNFIPLHSVERLCMREIYFRKLDEILGDDRYDFHYTLWNLIRQNFS